MEDVQSLVVKARAGDLAAFEDLVRRFQNMACGYAYARLGDFHLAEDAAQEAFIDAYRLLPDLRAPAAFSGWLRRIVFKHCDRLTRRRPRLVGLEAVAGMATDESGPERRLLLREVREAVGALPETQRQAFALFYLKCHSQKEIAAFLEVPVSTVKKRLHDARQKLQERMIDMVSETLQDHLPDELFSQRVIEELLDRPRPLEIAGHPVRALWDRIRAALPDYDVIAAGEEVVEANIYDAVQREMDVSYDAYHVDKRKILRTHTTHTTFQAIRGRTSPVRLLAAGRVFRPDREDATHAKVFHQVDGICIDQNADFAALQSTCERVLEAAFKAVECRWRHRNFGFVDQGAEFDIKLGDQWVGIGGCGLLKSAMLREAGYDPDAVGGFAFGLGLERLAMFELGLDDIRALWKPPYVPGG